MLLAAFLVAACSSDPPQASVVTAAPPPSAAAASTPPVAPAIRAIYEGYAANPNGFGRAEHFSRFYVEDNQRVDAACVAGEDHARCRGDRFSCVAVAPKKAGKVVDAVVVGEQPGVSASVRITTEFAGTKTVADVDAVVEDGRWKIDQVRCGW